MPLYTYHCDQCETELDVYRSIDKRNQAPTHCGHDMRRIVGNYNVMPDMEPYMTVSADKETGKRQYITGRRQHRDFLKRNGYLEVGNG